MASKDCVVLFALLILVFYDCIATSDAQSVTASFATNPVDNDRSAFFNCRVYNLGSNIVTIDRTIFSRTEQLVYGEDILQSVDDNFYINVVSNTDGSKQFTLTIRGVYYRFDAGTYTCKINTGTSVIAEQSAILNINYIPDSSNPRCSIVGSSSVDLSRSPGNEVRLACYSDLGYPLVDIEWSYQGCNSNNLPQPTLTSIGTYYSELKVTLSEDDNGGIFTCTISMPDGSFTNSCSKGPFLVQGGSVCDPDSMPTAPQQPTEPMMNIPTTRTTTVSNEIDEVGVTAFFQTNTVYEGSTASLTCNVYNLGSNFVSIDRTTSSTTESLSIGTTVLPPFANDLTVSVQYNNDGSQSYRLSISNVNPQQDSGTYSCKVHTSQNVVLTTQSAFLQIIAAIVPTTPELVAPSITASFQLNPVDEGSNAVFICQVYNLGSNYVTIQRTISSVTEQLTLGTQVSHSFTGDLMLSVRVNNDGSQTYTLTTMAVNSPQDIGTYTCNVQSSSQILATKSVFLQINAVIIRTTTTREPVYPYVTASFENSPVQEGSTAIFDCNVYNLGSNVVFIERTVSSVTESISIGTTVFPAVNNDIFVYVQHNNDGSRSYMLSISNVNSQQDSGTYSCKVQTSQNVVLATQSAFLQINAAIVPTTPVLVAPSVTASLQNNPVEEGSTASLTCNVYNLGSNFVSIDRITSSATESLSIGTTVLPAFANDLTVSVQYNNDGSQSYVLSISNVNPQQDSGTYSCKVQTSQNVVLATQSAFLQIIAAIVPTTPELVAPSVTASFQLNPVDEGSNAVFICQVYNLGSNYVTIQRTISSVTEQLTAGTQVLPSFTGDLMLSIRVNNDGSQTYILTTMAVNSPQDIGTYTCNVQSSSQILATKSVFLQINAVIIKSTTTNAPVYPYVTASFQNSPVNEGSTAIFNCNVYNLGSNFVSIERTVSSATESLSIGTTVYPAFANDLIVSVQYNNDGSRSYMLSISNVNSQQDSGSYTCKVQTSQNVVLTTQSAFLQINAVIVPTTPELAAPSVTASFQLNQVDEGSNALFICQVYNLGSNYVTILRTISSTTEQLTGGTQVLPGFINDLLLSVRINNDGSQTYTMTIIAANRRRDLGTYTCEVRTSQSQVLATQYAYLQINVIAMSTIPPNVPNNPSITVFFQTNPVDEGQTANLICQVYNLGQNFISTERMISSQTQPLTIGTAVLVDNMSISAQYNNDGSQTYTLAISQVTQLDAGTYKCKVETSQRQVLVMESTALQINAISLPPTPSPGQNDPDLIVYFQNNPLDEESSALLMCRVYSQGSNIVFIERTVYSRTEKLSMGADILPDVDDHFYLSVQDSNDDSKLYVMTIRGVYYNSDAGTYTCRMENPQGSVLAQQSTMLNINYDPQSADPRCSIIGSSADLTRSPGTELRLGCHSELGYPSVDISWSYSVCNQNRPLPQPTVTDSGAYYTELRVTLSEVDNGGVFTCTISRPDGSFSNSCSRGPFVIPGGIECNPVTNIPLVTMAMRDSTLPSKPTESMTTTIRDKNDADPNKTDKNGDTNDTNKENSKSSSSILISNSYVNILSLILMFCIRTLFSK